MTTRSPSRRAIGALLFAVLTSGTASSMAAQPQVALRPGQSPGPRFLVSTLTSDSGKLGFQVANAVRDRIAAEFDMRRLWVVPESSIVATLRSSGFQVDQPLPPSETKQLARMFGADEMLNGAVIKLPSGGYRVEADWSLSPRDDMVQPLPPVEAAKISDVAKAVAREFHNARKQVESVQKCNQLARAGRYDAAIAEARKAIDEYPKSVLGRVCIANVYEQQKLGPDSMSRIAQEILAIHPTNRRALALAADAYEAKGSTDDLILTLRRTASADSMNRAVRLRLARVLAGAGRIAEALPVVDSVVERDSTNVAAVDLQWRVLSAAKEWRRVVRTGGWLVSLDSSLATRDFYIRMIGAADAIPDSSAAAALATLAVKRFPTDDELGMLEVHYLRRIGELRRALAAVDVIVRRSPRAPGALVQKARLEGELRLATPDSLKSLLRTALQNGDDRSGIAGTALALGQAATRDSTTVGRLESLRAAIGYYKFADTVKTSDTTSFLVGYASFQFGQRAATEVRTTRRCDLAKEAQGALVDAQISLPKGAQSFREPLGRIMPQVAPSVAYVDQLVASVCR
jgi:tetratricopeptide (TPR) repeat protein